MLILEKLRGLLFPRNINCALCGEELTRAERGWCASCADAIEWGCIERQIEALDGVYSAAAYTGPLRELILGYKYNNKRYLAHGFAVQMCDLPRPENALFFPVPIHPLRRKERGFCQTTELCAELAAQTGLPFARDGLQRLRNTASQTQLDGAARRLNIQGAFAAEPALAAGKHCILVDDVVSTGATLSECAIALRSAGALGVTAWTIAT